MILDTGELWITGVARLAYLAVRDLQVSLEPLQEGVCRRAPSRPEIARDL